MTAPAVAFAHVRVLAEALGLPLDAAELAHAADRVDRKARQLAPLHAAAALLPPDARALGFSAGAIDA